MNLQNMSEEELSLLSYTDITYLLLKSNGSALNTKDIFKQICEILGYNENQYNAKIGDYYTSLTIDKRFLLLDTAEWDLQERHSAQHDTLEEEEEEEEEIEEVLEDEEGIVEDDYSDESEEDLDENLDDTDDPIDDDFDDLTIIDEEDVNEK